MANDITRNPSVLPARKRTHGELAEPGRVTEYERSHAAWEWSSDESRPSDDVADALERVRVLVDPRLDVVEDDAPNSVTHNAKGLKSGYNPYDSGALGKTRRKKKLNLRELSKWIETKRKVAGKPDDEK